MIAQAANYEFCVKPAAALAILHSGIPSAHKAFWDKKSPDDIYILHCKLIATPEKVIAMFDSSDACSSAQECIYGYLVSICLVICRLQN